MADRCGRNGGNAFQCRAFCRCGRAGGICDDSGGPGDALRNRSFKSFPDVQAAVNEALDAKLAPIKHMLASQFDAGPRLKDIVGGIGWIFGLVGVAAWFRRRG